MIDTLKRWYHTSFQTTIASVLGSLAFVDLTGYQESITDFIGHKGYAGLRVAGAIGIIWRATQARREPPKVCETCGNEP